VSTGTSEAGPPRERRCADAGESLVELLVSIAIMGIAVTAILGAITMGATASSLHKNEAQSQTLVRNWAEKVSDDSRTPGFWACPDPVIPLATGLPTGYTPTRSVSYWNPSTMKFDGPSCAGDKGLRKIQLTVSAPASLGPGFDQSIFLVVRNPCDPTIPLAPAC
jgi:type II secretory pathway pseudopilin PulG